MNKTGIVIQARMNSSRFPGKVLADFCGMPMLLFQIDRLKQMNLGAEIIVSTTSNPIDDKIVELCQSHGVRSFRGDELNVFERFRETAKHFELAHLVRLTADNPLPQEEVLKASISAHLRSKADLTSTREILPDRTIRRYMPKGCSVDVMKAETLLAIDPSKLDPFQKEHVIPIFFEAGYQIELIRDLRSFEPPPVDLSVDRAEDLERVVQYCKDQIGNSTM